MESSIIEYFASGKLFNRKNNDLFGVAMDNLHCGKLFVKLFGKYYSKYRIRTEIKNKELVDKIVQQYSLNQNQIIRNDETIFNEPSQVNYKNSDIILILKKELIVKVYDSIVEIYYSSNIQDAELKKIIRMTEEFKTETEINRKFYMVQKSLNNFELTEFNVKPFAIDLSVNYNEDFKNVHNIIFNSLNTKGKNGLILLHGKFGTGKTFYIRHLINSINRKFIYFPSNMIDALNSPSFLPFISEQPNSILVMEDCENILTPRVNGAVNSIGIQNLLNLGDGLLSDALSLNVICTFNASIKRIDDAILRKGRLIARYEFKELETKKAQALANKIGKNIVIENPMTVSEIYNYDDKCFEDFSTKIGFNTL
ncbi:MAG TPA: AAA family ATPase [Tenuifilaceae bacterium]|nr:AAA family ATPase [Tenuifilaceae bacterium]HRX32570.1 AAA family ATPase [Tenuifilaceae bacterium]